MAKTSAQLEKYRGQRHMQRFAVIRGDLRNRGELIGDPDILITATALHHQLTLMAQNLRHFQRIVGLPSTNKS